MIDRLIYRSRAVGVLPEVALDRILRASVPKNARLNITGALGFSQQTYVQFLEGPTTAIDELVTSLMADPRHAELTVLLRGSSERRLLPSWSMARMDLKMAAPEVEILLQAGDGLGLIALMATFAHEGIATG